MSVRHHDHLCANDLHFEMEGLNWHGWNRFALRMLKTVLWLTCVCSVICRWLTWGLSSIISIRAASFPDVVTVRRLILVFLNWSISLIFFFVASECSVRKNCIVWHVDERQHGNFRHIFPKLKAYRFFRNSKTLLAKVENNLTVRINLS